MPRSWRVRNRIPMYIAGSPDGVGNISVSDGRHGPSLCLGHLVTLSNWQPGRMPNRWQTGGKGFDGIRRCYAVQYAGWPGAGWAACLAGPASWVRIHRPPGDSAEVDSRRRRPGRHLDCQFPPQHPCRDLAALCHRPVHAGVQCRDAYLPGSAIRLSPARVRLRL